MTRLLALLAALALLVPGPALAEGEAAIPEPDDYRMDAYLAPVPDSLAGAHVVGDAAAHALWHAGVAFIDVLPRQPKPANLPKGTLWIEKKRLSIPGALWVPNVGYGRIRPEIDAYFRRALESVTGGDTAVPVVIFCRADCWMSWNAARRAVLDYGYTRIFWYPDGSDGWDFADLPLEQIARFE
ncbi:MAG: PQQ-dependent catabolism-associated CXXCW motif protein [Pseudomonadota bacterium]